MHIETQPLLHQDRSKDAMQSGESVTINVHLAGDAPESLTALVDDITSLIETAKHSVASSLRTEGRSRLSKLVQSLPSAKSEELRNIAQQDLPVASGALALASASSSVNFAKQGRYGEAVQAADIAMVMLGMPVGASIRAMVELIEQHNLASSKLDLSSYDELGHVRVAEPELHMDNITECTEISVEHLALQQFKDFFQKDQPVVIRGCAALWPAVKNWKSPQYLGTKYGHRTVPVELTKAGSESMEEKFCTLAEVIQMMLETRTVESPTVYLAQHPLFDYIPALERDIAHPTYMKIVGKERADLVNVWMGTAGSGSKLHFDSADNFLVQVVGEKKVLLISPDQSAAVYQNAPTDNISPVKVERPDHEKFPLFKTVKATTSILKPGDALYIPASHWHWVKALTGSISVNFWF